MCACVCTCVRPRPGQAGEEGWAGRAPSGGPEVPGSPQGCPWRLPGAGRGGRQDTILNSVSAGESLGDLSASGPHSPGRRGACPLSTGATARFFMDPCPSHLLPLDTSRPPPRGGSRSPAHPESPPLLVSAPPLSPQPRPPLSPAPGEPRLARLQVPSLRCPTSTPPLPHCGPLGGPEQAGLPTTWAWGGGTNRGRERAPQGQCRLGTGSLPLPLPRPGVGVLVGVSQLLCPACPRWSWGSLVPCWGRGREGRPLCGAEEAAASESCSGKRGRPLPPPSVSSGREGGRASVPSSLPGPGTLRVLSNAALP